MYGKETTVVQNKGKEKEKQMQKQGKAKGKRLHNKNGSNTAKEEEERQKGVQEKRGREVCVREEASERRIPLPPVSLKRSPGPVQWWCGREEAVRREREERSACRLPPASRIMF